MSRTRGYGNKGPPAGAKRFYLVLFLLLKLSKISSTCWNQEIQLRFIIKLWDNGRSEWVGTAIRAFFGVCV